jgi:TATA-box binding protein (TBP) (component of TFIID and TFIIIB)
MEYTWSNGQKTVVRIENLVYTCHLTQSNGAKQFRLQLARIFDIFRLQGAQFNKKRFAAVILRVRNPKIAILIFAEGKVVCTGAKLPEQARYHIYRITKQVQDSGYRKTGVSPFQIQNLVACTHVPARINQTALSLRHSNVCTFASRIFPGVIIRHNATLGKITTLLFHSGNMVLTGAKDIRGIERALDFSKPIIEQYTISEDGKDTVPAITTEKADHIFSRPALQSNAAIRNELKKRKLEADEVKHPTIEPIPLKVIKVQPKLEPEIEEKNTGPINHPAILAGLLGKRTEISVH